jgi:hypothetical protein
MNEDAIAVFIPIVAIVMSLSIPIVYTIMDYRRRRDIVEAHHRERLAAIERGIDIPPLPESFYQPISRRPPRTDSTLLPGLIWFFVGVTLFVALWSVARESWSYFGLIPAGVGLAYLIYYAVEGRKRVPEADTTGATGEIKGST